MRYKCLKNNVFVVFYNIPSGYVPYSYFVSTSVSDQPQHKLLILDNEKDNIKCT